MTNIFKDKQYWALMITSPIIGIILTLHTISYKTLELGVALHGTFLDSNAILISILFSTTYLITSIFIRKQNLDSPILPTLKGYAEFCNIALGMAIGWVLGIRIYVLNFYNWQNGPVSLHGGGEIIFACCLLLFVITLSIRGGDSIIRDKRTS